VALVSLTGCAPRTAKVSVPVEPPQSFSESGAVEPPVRWWTAFDDPRLNGLVERALQSNFDLESAWQRLRQARAVIEREAAALYPELDAEGEAAAREPEFDESERLRLGLASVYEVDLWGRIRSRADAERFRARATLADYRTAALSLSAEVARTWFQLLEARSQRNLLEEQVRTNEKVLQLLRVRFGSGQIRAVDILRQRQLVEATREQRIAAESRIGVLEHLLAVLLGRAPQEGVEAAGSALPELPARPATGLPVELIRRRPDIVRAYNLLQAADRDLAAAISNQYPRLTLTASLSTGGEDAAELFDEWARSFAGSLVAPLIDGGRRDAEVDRTEALKQQRLYEYGQATLTAFQEVENALVQEQKQAERIDSLEQQVRLASRAYDQLRVEYFNGVSDYIDVLTALTDAQELRRDLLSARLSLLEFRIALYRALAGGFTPHAGRDG
jgi:NodT family efflux transporter outer membrane factor (OMF) lipoprotein